MFTKASAFSLAHLESAPLEALWRELSALPAKTRVVEEHISAQLVCAACEPILGQPAWVVISVLEAVLAERQAKIDASMRTTTTEIVQTTVGKPAAQTEPTVMVANPTELVWSGATAARSCARSTRQAIEDLFGAVENEVFVAGYSFDHATDLFAPLFAKMAALSAEGRPLPKVRIVLDCSRKQVTNSISPEELARRVYDDFLRTCWQASSIVPEVRYLRESAERSADQFARCSMHAKCIIVDRKKSLVGSANFSNRGRDRNLEVGALISERHFVSSLCAEWDALWPRLIELSANDASA